MVALAEAATKGSATKTFAHKPSAARVRVRDAIEAEIAPITLISKSVITATSPYLLSVDPRGRGASLAHLLSKLPMASVSSFYGQPAGVDLRSWRSLLP